MKERFDRIETRLDKIDEHLMEYNKQLAVHIEGVVQNRKHIAKLEIDVDEITAHVHEVKGVGKFFKYLGISISLVGGFFRNFKNTRSIINDRSCNKIDSNA